MYDIFLRDVTIRLMKRAWTTAIETPSRMELEGHTYRSSLEKLIYCLTLYNPPRKGWKTSLKSKFRVESPAVFAFSIFYMIAGGVMLSLLVASSFTAPPHIGVLAFLSLITAYSLIQMKKWAVLLTTILFFLGAAFSIPVLFVEMNRQTFSSSLGALLFNLALIIHVIISLFAFVYVAAKRDHFE